MIADNQPSVFKEKPVINMNILNFIIRIFFFELLYICNPNITACNRIALYIIKTFRKARAPKQTVKQQFRQTTILKAFINFTITKCMDFLCVRVNT